jgi:hypothetical protein
VDFFQSSAILYDWFEHTCSFFDFCVFLSSFFLLSFFTYACSIYSNIIMVSSFMSLPHLCFDDIIFILRNDLTSEECEKLSFYVWVQVEIGWGEKCDFKRKKKTELSLKVCNLILLMTFPSWLVSEIYTFRYISIFIYFQQILWLFGTCKQWD